jgi:hypothetical protein
MSTVPAIDEIAQRAHAVINQPNDKTRAMYLAAASPDVVLALILRVKCAREARDLIAAAMNDLRCECVGEHAYLECPRSKVAKAFSLLLNDREEKP